MKRDMDLVRSILLILEESQDKWYDLNKMADRVGGNTREIRYHLRIMDDAGLIHHDPAGDLIELRITWDGHEFLEAIRDDEVWERVKERMSIGGGFVYEIARSTALEFVEEKVNPNRKKSLQAQLLRRNDNLNELEEQAANYGASAVPLELKNKIKAEKEAIEEIKGKLEILKS